MDSLNVKTVKVIVYCARNLRSREGEREPLSWAVFGFGEEKCCTRQVRNRNPKWNEESTFTVADTSTPLLLVVKDNNDILGQIVIATQDLPHADHFLKWVPLIMPGDTNKVWGQVCMDCWIDDYNTDELSPPMRRAMASSDAYARSQSCLGFSSTFRAQDRHRSTSSSFRNHNSEYIHCPTYWGKRNRHRSVSLVRTFPSFEHSSGGEFIQIPGTNLRITNKFIANARVPNHTLFKWDGTNKFYPPKIQRIVPTSGPAKGGTLIQITGKYLGTSKEDIIKLKVADCDCLPSLQFYSSNKVMVITSACTGIGPISIATKSGGPSSSKLIFEFVDETMSGSYAANYISGSSEQNEVSKITDEKFNGEIETLKKENMELRKYIDKLHAYLMIHYPDALDIENITKMYSE